MDRMRYPKHGVIDHFVTVGMHAHGLGHHRLGLVGHHAKLPTMTPLGPELGLVVEQVKTDAKGMGANADDVFFGAGVST
jgi:hypothetical protein